MLPVASRWFPWHWSVSRLCSLSPMAVNVIVLQIQPHYHLHVKINFIGSLLLREPSLFLVWHSNHFRTWPQHRFPTSAPTGLPTLTPATQTLCSKHVAPVIHVSTMSHLVAFHLLCPLPRMPCVLMNFYSSFKTQIKYHFLLQTSLIPHVKAVTSSSGLPQLLINTSILVLVQIFP